MRASLFAAVALLGALGIIFHAIPSERAITSTALDMAGQSAPPQPYEGQPAKPVLVELFTSEGCSSCPPADRLLARLEQTQPVPGAEIIALEQHVDYWNDLGWKDPFSSSQFSERQDAYVRALHDSSAYTPEMVVDGVTAFVGSSQRDALEAIAKAARVAKSVVELERRQDSKANAETVPLRARVESSSGWNAGAAADVFLAITENGLASNVTRGENAGEQLGHRAVVRELRVLGRVNAGGSFSAELDLRLSSNWNRQNLRAVVFVQERTSRRILGAAALSLSAPGNGS